ncbi:MAG: excinuclease ABC subunit A [Bacteroidetes bacterium MED-G21]|nr:MAG: excinuclease ABC subunit A [Bacteroidetes bacterium MED-G21]
MKEFDRLDSKDHILIKGARLHNLKNIDLAIPRNKFVVITGLSGSGKSSLAFDTLYAEGQRRYVESLSSYARQFLGRLNKPKVESIKGISPAIAIEQKVNSKNPRSTVGTSTEIYDYIKLLFARIGKTYSPISGKEVKKHSIQDVVDFISKKDIGSKFYILAPTNNDKKDQKLYLQMLLQQGYQRLKYGDDILRIEDILNEEMNLSSDFHLLIDRLSVNNNISERLADSIQTAFHEGKGECTIEFFNSKDIQTFNNRFELDGIKFEQPSIHLFTFNNPVGACKTCEGFGNIMGIDQDLVIPNTGLSIYEDAIACWRGEKLSKYKEDIIFNAEKWNIPIHKPYFKLSKKQKHFLWEGDKDFKGINPFFAQLEKKNYKIQNRVLLSRYRGKTKCPECDGKRLRTEAEFVKIAGYSIFDIIDLPIDELRNIFDNLKLNKHEAKIASRILTEIKNRIQFLMDVGLNYLTLNRRSSSLSGGESQRINLATSLGSSLVGSMYILDEPSIGLHSKDTERLIKILRSLRDIGNTVIVVEHDEDIIKAADLVVDIGPKAGIHGGELMFRGTFKEIEKEKDSLTAQYLNGNINIKIPKKRNFTNTIEINGARQHNLKNINVKIPLNALTVVSGVSGSGKSSLIKNILYPALVKKLGGYGPKAGQFDSLTGNLKNISAVEFIDQNPIGKSSRSNPVTYIKAYDDIRNLYAKQSLSSARAYKAKHFSFNTDGGRCEHCSGEGEVTIEMQFMANVHLECEHCKGKRFKDEILDVKFQNKNIADILNMTINESIEFFQKAEQTKISKRLEPLQDVGLGYIHLGQSSSTLSGGEAQRVKLASFLGKGKREGQQFFIFDEPTTGLHFHDIKKLLESFNALIENGHTILVIEHNQDVIKCADWLIDLGKEGGNKGGELIFQGLPEDIVNCKKSATGQFLKEKFKHLTAKL